MLRMLAEVTADFWDDPFHHAALAAGFIAFAEGRLKDSDYVKRLAYEIYEEHLAEKIASRSANFPASAPPSR
ncbi:MAG: hypothetical protein K8U57_36040 [Planctomycetes bacterium]|nr:hypothetical protein [Planctomycetota bacterium]